MAQNGLVDFGYPATKARGTVFFWLKGTKKSTYGFCCRSIIVTEPHSCIICHIARCKCKSGKQEYCTGIDIRFKTFFYSHPFGFFDLSVYSGICTV